MYAEALTDSRALRCFVAQFGADPAASLGARPRSDREHDRRPDDKPRGDRDHDRRPDDRERDREAERARQAGRERDRDADLQRAPDRDRERRDDRDRSAVESLKTPSSFNGQQARCLLLSKLSQVALRAPLQDFIRTSISL